jgi:hypothetical protein
VEARYYGHHHGDDDNRYPDVPITTHAHLMTMAVSPDNTSVSRPEACRTQSLSPFRQRPSARAKNIEVVLSTQIINGEPGTPRIDAVYFW